MAWLGQKSDPTRERTEMTVANIGKSIHIKGELSGNEDLTIEGKVEGKITLNGYSVTIGQSGLVMAEIHAKSVVVCGQVRGDITADESVEVAATGTVLGNVRAPRVVLADGAHFKGSVDMERAPEAARRATPAKAATCLRLSLPSSGRSASRVSATIGPTPGTLRSRSALAW